MYTFQLNVSTVVGIEVRERSDALRTTHSEERTHYSRLERTALVASETAN